jgi:RNA polymerase nonessential primary-like sigma factor
MDNYSKLLRHKLLTKGETYDLIIEYQSSSDSKVKQQIIDTLIRHNFKLLYKFAINFYNSKTKSTVETDDLIQACMEAVEISATKFDCSRNLAFSTYLVGWCRGKCSRLYDKESSTVRLPVHLTELIKKINTYKAKYNLQFNKYPSVTEIAIGVDKSPEAVQKALDNYHNFSQLQSLNLLVGDEGVTQLLELIEDTLYSTESYMDSLAQSEYLDSLLANLTIEERGLLEMRYGLEGNNPHTLETLAQKTSVTRESIRGKIVKAISKIRKASLINK